MSEHPYRPLFQPRGGRLRRDSGEIKFALGFAVVSGAGAYGAYTLASGGGTLRAIVCWIVVVLAGLAALAGTVAALFGRHASCPSCGKTLAAVDKQDEVVQCRNCHGYLVTRDHHVVPADDDHLAARPRFLIEVTKGSLPAFRLPDRCCVCCGPATRVDELLVHDSKHVENLLFNAMGIALGAAVGVGVVRTGGHGEILLTVPYCAACSDGVSALPLSDTLQLRFRSLRYARAVGEANKLPPRV